MVAAALEVEDASELLAFVTIARKPDGDYSAHYQRAQGVEEPLRASQAANLLRWLADAIEVDAL